MSAEGRRRHLRCAICVLALLPVGALVSAHDARAAIHIQAFRFSLEEAGGEPSTQAGAHPAQATTFLAFTGEGPSSYENPRDLTVDFPPGLVGIAPAVPTCKAAEFTAGGCSPESQVGFVKLVQVEEGDDSANFYALSRLEAMPGAAAEFGVNAGGPSVRLRLGVRAGGGLSISAKNLPQTVILNEVTITLWGVPADPSHDSLRGKCLTGEGPTGGSCPSEALRRPLLANPSSCLPVLSLSARVDSWQNPGVFDSATASTMASGGEPVGIEGCESLDFRPTVTVGTSVPTPRTPTGLTFVLHAPQPQSADAPTEASLDDASVTLPDGVAISPPAAAGLGACAAGQFRLGDDSQPSCPDASKLGTMTVETPLLAAPSSGPVYLARPGENPFASRFAIYAVAAADGALIKLAGRVDPDPVTGQLRVTFEDLPQLPFSEVTIALFNGPRAPLATPSRCGTYTSASELTAWGAQVAVARSTAFELTAGCSEPSFDPSLRAGVVSPAAGSYSPFALRLERGDRDAEFASSLSLELPPGVSAALGATSSCPEGKLVANGSVLSSCPDSSRIGSAVVGAGLGAKPLYLAGVVYLAGPYRGAPFSLAAIVPARAGPFDLGTIVERVAVAVDPRSGQLITRADGLPRIRDGIPLELRSLSLRLDRPGFIRSPTSCRPMAITGTASTGRGQSVALSQPFQVGGCSRLAFKPRISLHVLNGVRRGGHPALRAVLHAGPDEATLAAAAIGLPTGELLDLRHLGAMCAPGVPPERCPDSSRLGRARVWSPLLGDSLAGSIYLRAPSGRLPRLLVDLRGGGFQFMLEGRVTAARGRLRLHLSGLPDLPLTKAVLTLAGGRRGLLVNSESLCGRPQRAEASLIGHNGALRGLRPLLRPRGC
jgi:hypothetical protein